MHLVLQPYSAAAATLTVAPGTIRTKPSSGVPPSTTIKSRDPEAPGKQFVVQATFNDTYESSLQDPTSTKYKETEAKYGRLLTKLYQKRGMDNKSFASNAVFSPKPDIARALGGGGGTSVVSSSVIPIWQKKKKTTKKLIWGLCLSLNIAR